MTSTDGANPAKWLNQHLLQPNSSFHFHATHTTEEKKLCFLRFCFINILQILLCTCRNLKGGNEQVGLVPETGKLELRQRLCIFWISYGRISICGSLASYVPRVSNGSHFYYHSPRGVEHFCHLHSSWLGIIQFGSMTLQKFSKLQNAIKSFF